MTRETIEWRRRRRKGGKHGQGRRESNMGKNPSRRGRGEGERFLNSSIFSNLKVKDKQN